MPFRPIQIQVPDDDYWRRQIKCQYACPVNTDARGYVRAIAAGDFESAYLIARGPNPLASICGRVCGAPCEAACRRGALDQPIAIRALKRFVTDRYGPEAFTRETLKPIELLKRVLRGSAARECAAAEEIGALPSRGLQSARTSGRTEVRDSVAIIGSGPAGLAAAHDLALLGYRPTVYEMEPIPAGMLAVGIPEYRLPRDLIRAEVDVIRALGVEFICNTKVGTDIAMKELRDRHAATIIAVGAKRSRLVPIPGGDGPGVLGGVEFLRDVALSSRGLQPARTSARTKVRGSRGSTLAQLGKRIVVIGGGNVAYDVSRTVIRQIGYDVSRSALRQVEDAEVHLCCLESVDEMPAEDVEILEGREEGVQLHASLGPVEIHRDPNGRVKGMTFKRCVRVFDDAGKFSPKFDESDTKTFEADTIVWAIGQQPDLSFIDPDGDVKLTERGQIDCKSDTLETTAPDVFVAGDIAYGPRLLIDAVASGKKCARTVHAYLSGTPLSPTHAFVHLNIAHYARERDYEKRERIEVPTVSAKERRRSQQTVVERGYDAPACMREASRCLDCGVNTIFDSEKCILCGGCADVCPELCLQLVSCDRLRGDAALDELVAQRYGATDLASMSAIIKDEEKCIRCALCAERCPVDAITMERFRFSSAWVTSET